MVCIFGSLIVYFALFKNNDDVNVNIDNSHNSNLSNNISGNNTNTTPVVKDDIKYLVIDEYCILYNKTKNKFIEKIMKILQHLYFYSIDIA